MESGSRIGISTYAFFWQWHETAEDPITLPDMLAETARLGGNVFQVCDYPPFQEFDEHQVRALADQATGLGITLEVGTRGIDAEHLRRFLQLAQWAGSSIVRSMVPGSDADRAADELRTVAPEFEAAGVTLALETYEQVPTQRLVDIVTEVGSENVGICLDPGNSVAALETPRSTIELCAPHVKNVHVKDFAFSRQAGWIGFTYAGAKLGEGLLDYDYLLESVRPTERGLSQIVEHWVVWQGESAATIAAERAWTEHAMRFLLERNAPRAH